MKERIVGSAQYFYTHIEKRSLPLETAKALVNVYNRAGSKEIALSLLERSKTHLSRWIEDSSQVQIYKRFFLYISRKERLSLPEAMSPFLLVNCWESFYEVMIRDRSVRRDAYRRIKEFFEGLNIEDILEISDPQELFRGLLFRVGEWHGHGFFLSTHIAYMINPHVFIPITPSAGGSLNIKEENSYFRLIESVREQGIKPIEAYSFMHMLFESCPSKVRGAELVLGIDRELELLKEAERLWNDHKFYEAHEVLEEVWELTRDTKIKECYQGVIRFAIALHHASENRKDKAVNVLRKAVPQMKGCRERVRLNLSELCSSAEKILRGLEKGEPAGSLPELRVI